MVSKAKQQKHHFYRRQLERMPENVTSDEVVKIIRSQFGVVVRKQSHRMKNIISPGKFTRVQLLASS